MQTQEMSLHTDDLSSSWGLPPGSGSSGLRGGGLSSLNNTGTSGWGAPPPNSSAASATGWGIPPGSGSTGLVNSQSSTSLSGSGAPSSSSPPSSVGSNQSSAITGQSNLSSANNNHPGGSNQWGSPSPNRGASQITNGQPTISGSQMNNNPSTNATNVPPGGNSMQMSNPIGNSSSIMNPPNSPMNPGSVSTNPNVSGGSGSGSGSGGTGCGSGGIITNSGTSSWAQAAGKSLQSSGNTPNATLNTQQPQIHPGNGPPSNNSPNNPSLPTGGLGGLGATTGASSGNSTSKQIELLNSMREALFSTDGWGGQNVNQDSGWDVPGSPEPHHKDLGMGQGGVAAGTTGANNGSGSWKMTVNNGTDLWEANLRGGVPPPQPITQKVPWGHTPTSNHGGTWGEEDESDSSNVWNGIPPAGSTNIAPANSSQPNEGGRGQWMSGGGGSNAGPQQIQQQQQQPGREPSNPLWNTPQTHPMKKDTPDSWNSIGGGNSGNGGSNGSGGGRGDVIGPNNWGSNDNRGIQGRGMSNGQMDQGMWNKPPQQQQQQPQQHQPQWGSNGPTGDSGQGHMGGHGVVPKEKPGWDDISPPAQRRVVPNIPNYDDGTSLWGNPLPGQQQQQQQQQPPPQQRGMSSNRGMPNKMDSGNPMWGHGGGGSSNGNRNGWQNQAPPNMQQGMFNGSGGEQQGWNDDKLNSWGEPPMQPQQQQQQHNSWGKPKTPTNQGDQGGGWGVDGLVDTSNWGAPSKTQRFLNGSKTHHHQEFWTTSKPNVMQLLSDVIGCKKDDIDQMALRASSMNIADAIDNLDMGGMGSGGRGGQMDNFGGTPWGMGGGNGPPMQSGGGGSRRGGPPDDHFDMGLGNVAPNGPIGGGNNSFMNPQQRGGNGSGGFPGNSGGFPGGNSLSNNMMGNPNMGGGMNNPMIQKMLSQQQQQPQAPALQFPFNSNNVRGQPNNPTSNQLKMLVQQIQMAVQAGYLNSQILQHPLPQQSLYLLNQLLQQIKIFQQLTQAQHQMAKSTNSNTALQLNVQITKTKQQINNLHNQISAQQAQHAKEQQQQQHQQHRLASSGIGNQPGSSDFYKNPPIMSSNSSNVMDPMLSAIQSNFGQDFGIKDGPVSHQQTSRLTQWTRVPSLEKDDIGSDFSRAPGPQTNNASGGLLKNNSSLILGQSDNSTWSTGVPRAGSDGWPTDSSNTNTSDDSSNKLQLGTNDFGSFGDLVPEFEPGKPWKGNQILKSVEDDPTLTPGSVVRSPLSLAAIKDASEIFSKPSQPSASAADTLSTPLSLSSNTWSFSPSGSSMTMANSMAKLNTTKSWGDDMGGSNRGGRDPWEYGSGNSSVGQGGANRPPPGMGLPQKSTGGNSGSGNGNFSGSQNPSFNTYRNNQAGQQQQPNTSWGSNSGHYWLLLRNLTPQIDGSTLKTLCQQHGPLTKFQLYLNHGIALVKYSTQVTQTAQNALNNCVLGNTTILAETASETDVHNLMQGLNGGAAAQNSSNNSGFGSGNPNKTGGENPWSVSRNTNKGTGQWDVDRDNSPLWNSPWGSSNMDAPDRSTPSSLNNLLPGDLLGGESA